MTIKFLNYRAITLSKVGTAASENGDFSKVRMINGSTFSLFETLVLCDFIAAGGREKSFI